MHRAPELHPRRKEKHDAIADERNALLGSGGESTTPGQTQLTDVLSVHLLEGAEPLGVIRSAEHQPVVWRWIQEVLVRHRNEPLLLCMSRKRGKRSEEGGCEQQFAHLGVCLGVGQTLSTWAPTRWRECSANPRRSALINAPASEDVRAGTRRPEPCIPWFTRGPTRSCNYERRPGTPPARQLLPSAPTVIAIHPRSLRRQPTR